MTKPCPKCHGYGTIPLLPVQTAADWQVCSTCKGTGWVKEKKL